MTLAFHPPKGVSLKDYYRQVIEKSVEMIRATGARVWLVKQVPTQSFEPTKDLAVLAMKGENTVGLGKSYEEHLKELAYTNSILDKLAEQDGIYIIDPVPILCADHKVCRTEHDGWSLYRDDNHVSTKGALLLKPMMKAFIEKMKEKQE